MISKIIFIPLRNVVIVQKILDWDIFLKLIIKVGTTFLESTLRSSQVMRPSCFSSKIWEKKILELIDAVESMPQMKKCMHKWISLLSVSFLKNSTWQGDQASFFGIMSQVILITLSHFHSILCPTICFSGKKAHCYLLTDAQFSCLAEFWAWFFAIDPLCLISCIFGPCRWWLVRLPSCHFKMPFIPTDALKIC